MKHQIYKLLFLLAALTIVGCECPYLEERHGESNYEYYRRTGYNRLTADLLPGLWQCYYPMYVGNVEFKEIYIPSTVSYIGDDAFADCTSLTGIYFGETGEEGSHTGVRSAETRHDSDTDEVARYNLSGRPCTPSDKGVQIIVYSDYTTRTVIED